MQQNFVGQILDNKYDLRAEIGRGGMGSVYLAYHLGTKRPVAVKVIAPQYMRRTEFVERFKREAEAAGRLTHPNVVNVTDFGFAQTANGRLAYLVMEYLEGCTLGEVLAEEKNLPLSWAVDILEQVCSAVGEAHKQGIIHRDLKPDNIWLEPNRRGGYTVKVLDFGIAKLEEPTAEYSFEEVGAHIPGTAPVPPTIHAGDEAETIGYETIIERAGGDARTQILTDSAADKTAIMPLDPAKTVPAVPNHTQADSSIYEKTTADITRVGAIMGTPLYMSPEQCRSERPSQSSDIYSLGVIAYQMLSGKTPFAGENLSVIAGHLELLPPKFRARGVPRKVRKAVMSALSKDAIDRPASAELFSSRLRAYSDGVIALCRNSLVVYIQNFSRLIWFSLLLYFPTIGLGALAFLVSVLQFNGMFSAGILPTVGSIVQGVIKHVNIAATVSAETLITAAATWIVVQYIDAPLRKFRVTGAFKALLSKWTQFLWIIPLRVVLAVFVQGDLPGFPVAVMFLLSFVDTLIFWFLPAVIMMEKVGGLRALSRSWRLSLRIIGTVIAAMIVIQAIGLVVSGGATVVFMNLAALAAQAFFPRAAELPWQNFAELVGGLAIIVVKISGALLLPFFAVLTAMTYLKARHAGGESTAMLLAELKNSEALQTRWQNRIRHSSQRISASSTQRPPR